MLFALPLLWGWMQAAERGSSARGRFFSLATVLAGLAFASDLLFWHMSIMRTTVANSTFFATGAPLWVVLFGWLLFRERVSTAVLGGLLLCLAGGGALVWQSMHPAPEHLPGDLFGVATGMFFGLYFLAVRAARVGTGAARVTFEISLVTVVVLAVAAFALDDHVMPRSPTGWLAVQVLGWVSHAGGHGLLSVTLGRLPAVFSSLVIFLEAIAAAVLAWAILDEPISLAQGLGGLLIVCGIWIARPRRAGPAARDRKP